MAANETMPAGDSPMLTVREVADFLRVSHVTVIRRINEGAIAAIKVGKNYRIAREDLQTYVNEASIRTREDI